MNELPFMAVAALARRHEWAEREYARLHAEAVEARLTAVARTEERAARRRARLRARLSGLRRTRRSGGPAVHCARAAARSAARQAGRPASGVRLAGGTR